MTGSGPVDPRARFPSDWEVPPFEEAILGPRTWPAVLVIPVINEGERIRRQLEAVAALGAPIDVVIADGGSTDGSVELAFLAGTGVRARLTKRGPGRLSAQLRIAYAWALAEGYDSIVTVDGNGKDGMEGILAILARLAEGHGYVQGSRYVVGGRAINTPLSRRLAGRLVHAPAVSLAARHRFTDTTNGFRGYSAAYLRDPRVQPFRAVFSDYGLLFYLSVRASQLGYPVCEVGVTRAYPETGPVPTKIGGWRGKAAMLGELFAAVSGRYAP